MADKVWVVHLETWELRLMYTVDAREAVRLGDYAYAPVGVLNRRGRRREPPASPARLRQPEMGEP